MKEYNLSFMISIRLSVYIEQNRVTRNGTLKSTTNPWKMETTTNCCPAVRVMMGSVVSIVVAPPAEMGARLPNQRTSKGAATIRKWTLLPGVDAATRTLQLRLEVDNADEALKPGMNAWLQLNTASEPMLLIPSQALIDTGSEQRVITVDADGRFVPKRVAVFQASQGVTALRSGLAEGEKVVSSGLFLIDSEANISGALERMRSESATHAH